MNWWIVILVAAAMVGLRVLKVRMLPWLGAWWLGIFVILRHGFGVPLPVSVIKIYMCIASGALVAYVMSDSQRVKEVGGPLTAFLVEKKYLPWLVLVAAAVPAYVAWQIYADLTQEPVASNFGRTVHPASPESIDVHGETLNLVKKTNPYRHLEKEDPEAFQEHVRNGKRVYYENCFYCHGDTLAGDGLFAHGLNPIPTDFTGPNVLPNFTESFFFWRISKGGVGLPEEGGPWDSAMPAWESFLTTEEMWDVILFLYEQISTDQTKYRPRALAEEH